MVVRYTLYMYVCASLRGRYYEGNDVVDESH